jgi:N-methylhydantoinase A/oxoprolinase/acetone carboxylase beta subunit
LSAFGLHAARFERFAHRQVLEVLRARRDEEIDDDHPTRLAEIVQELSDTARARVERENVEASDITISRVLALVRLAGQDATLEVDLLKGSPREASAAVSPTVDVTDLLERFDAEYLRTYGYEAPDRAVELESIRVVAASRGGASVGSESGGARAATTVQQAPADSQQRTERVWFGDRWREVAVVERTTLALRPPLAGPCLVTEPHSLTVVEPGWTVRVDRTGALQLRSLG